MNPSLMGYEAAVLAALGDGDLARVADELTTLEATVAGDSALHAALTDTSIPARSRRAFVADLLASKLSAPAVRIAAYAAYSSAAQDVPVSLTEAAQRARAVSSGASDEPPLGVLAARARVGGFARALFEDQHAEALEGVEDELFGWARLVGGDAALRQVLTNRDLATPERAAVVGELLDGRVSAVTRSLATYAVVGGRPRDLVGTLQWLVDLVAAERGWRVARVRTARAIDEPAREALAATLGSLVGHPVELEVAEESSLLGGVLVEVGDLRVDATARGRLEALREQLTEERRRTTTRAAAL